MLDNNFIVAFEGNYGFGKTTQCNKLCDYLAREERKRQISPRLYRGGIL